MRSCAWRRGGDDLRVSSEKTGLATWVLRTPGRQSQKIGIELTGFIDVTDVNTNVIDAGDARPRRLTGGAGIKRGGSHWSAERNDNGSILQATLGSEQTVHDCEILSHVKEAEDHRQQRR
jgi:hypothetical protein